MKNSSFLLAIFAILVLSAVEGCAPTPIPTLVPTIAPTETLTPTATVVPTQTNTPTATIAPPFVLPTRAASRITPSAFPVLGEPPNSFRFQFDSGVSPEKRDAVRNGIALSQLVWGEVGPTTVITLQSLDALVEEERRNYGYPAGSSLVTISRQRWEESVICKTTEGIVFCYAPRIQAPAAPRVDITIIHEYFHRVQGALSKNARSRGPNWLIEGSAEYAQTVVGARYGIPDFYGTASIATQRQFAMFRSRGVTKPLSTMETAAGAQDEDYFSSYSLGYLAVDYLASNAGDQAVLKNYWEYLATMSWENAFAKAFGVTPEDFYKRFEEYRSAEFPAYCENWARGSFGIEYRRALAPGSIPGFAADLTPHIFCVTGYDYVNMSVAQKNAALKLPLASARRNTCAANCIVIFLNATTPKGIYNLGFELPDGRKAQTTFQQP